MISIYHQPGNRGGKKALEARYPLVYLQTDPAGDWPGREEDDLEPGAWRPAAERNMMFSLRGMVGGFASRAQIVCSYFGRGRKVVMKVPEMHFGLWSGWMHHFNRDCSRLPGCGM